MTAREQLLREIQHSSETLVKEVLDFLLFARSRNYPFVESEVRDRQTPPQPIREFTQELMQDAPPEELAKLPAAQHQVLTLNDLISSIPNNFTYPDDVREFTESEPLGRELPEIDWEAKWEQWFEECETIPISTTTTQQTYAPAIKSQKTEIDWTNDPCIGMWQERQDMDDSTTWVRNIRNSEWS